MHLESTPNLIYMQAELICGEMLNKCTTVLCIRLAINLITKL